MTNTLVAQFTISDHAQHSSIINSVKILFINVFKFLKINLFISGHVELCWSRCTRTPGQTTSVSLVNHQVLQMLTCYWTYPTWNTKFIWLRNVASLKQIDYLKLFNRLNTLKIPCAIFWMFQTYDFYFSGSFSICKMCLISFS